MSVSWDKHVSMEWLALKPEPEQLSSLKVILRLSVWIFALILSGLPQAYCKDILTRKPVNTSILTVGW